MNIYTGNPKFYYIDPTLDSAVAGDGSSVAKAATSFPTDFDTDDVVYLVRRSSDTYSAILEAITSTKTWSTPKTVSIIGMPKDGDELYAKMPEDAQSAWGADEEDYAQVTELTTGSYQHQFTNCTNLFMFRICFKTQRTDSAGDTAVLYFKNATYGTNVWIDRCWFRSNLIDFTVSGASSVNYRAGKRYIDVENVASAPGHFARITHTRLDVWGNGYGIYLGYTDDIYISDCEFHCAQNKSSDPVIYWNYNSNLGQWGANVTANNLSAYYYFSTAGDSYMNAILGGDCKCIKVSNVTIQMANTQNFSCYGTTSCNFSNGCISVYLTGAGSIFENIYARIPTVGTNDSILKILYYQDTDSTSYMNYSEGQYVIIRNISIEAETEYSESSYRTDWYSTPYYRGSDAGLIRFWTSGNRGRQALNDCLIQNVTINAPLGYAICATQAMLDLADCDISGAVYAYRCVGKIKSITTWYPGYALCDAYCNTLYVEEINCNTDNPRWEYNAQSAVQINNYDSAILVGTSNIRCYLAPSATNLSSDNNYNCNYVCTNDQMKGAYYARSYTACAETWSAYRRGSVSNCSLRLTNENVSDIYRPLQVGASPFKGIAQTTTAGDHTMTFYVAMYGYNDYSQIRDRFFATIELPTGEKVYSNLGVWSLDEDSVWENLDGYTSYKLTIPFHLDEDGEVNCYFSWSWYMVGAATFVDPFPTIS